MRATAHAYCTGPLHSFWYLALAFGNRPSG